MDVTIQISDRDYQRMVVGGKRIEGSIGLVSPTEGNFNAYTRRTRLQDDSVHKMAHGRIRISDKRTCVRLWFDHGAELIDVPMAIEREGREASAFAYEIEMINNI